MTRTKLFLAVGLSLVALFALATGANAKTSKGGLPDLVVTKVSKPPKSKTVGSKIKLVVTLKNKGSGEAGKSKLGLYLGKGNKHVKKDKRLKRVKVKPLAAGKKKKLKLQVVLPAKTVTGKYRLFACSDDTKKVKESKEGNCKGTRKLTLTPVPKPAVPAFTATNPIEWGFSQNAARKDVEAGTPITATLRAANGLAGAAGYTQAAVAPSPFTGGTSVTLTPDSDDDGGVGVALPFAFPFGGVNETFVSVGTNGWVSFGAPAFDYWDDSQPDYYQGGAALVGNYYRGIMPYWADLDLATDGGGTIKEVIAADGKSVAFQWDIGQHSSGKPRRFLQLVLFADGSFRLDYPGANEAGGAKSFVGFSLGEGPTSATVVSIEGTTVPASSLLFTPNPVTAETATATGQLSTTLPFGSTLLTADPGCVLALAPTAFENGRVDCPVAGLLPGEQITRQVTFAAPPNFPGETEPPNFRFTGTYAAGPFNLADADEIAARSTSLPANAIELNAKPSKPNPPKAGFATEFEVDLFATKSGGLDEPTATFSLPANTTLTGIAVSGKGLPCGPLVGGQITCKLASGGTGATVVVTLVPGGATLGTPLTLAVSASALNAPTVSDSVTTSAVIAGP